MSSRFVPIFTVLTGLLALWFVGTVYLNTPWQRDVYERAGQDYPGFAQLVRDTMAQERPVMPSPQQVAKEFWETTFEKKITSKRSLVYHAQITLSTTLLGFLIGTTIGILLAIGIVHSRTLNASLMPWIIASQTVPILALAPMIVVVLGAVGMTGIFPKAVISTYLSFFPVAVGMVKGLRAPDQMQLDLMRTYSASRWQTLLKLRLPASVPYLFTSMKIAVAASLVGAIVGELPTGAVAGLGARLLAGSYYGQTVQIWSALFMASILAGLLVFAIGWAGQKVNQRMGVRG